MRSVLSHSFSRHVFAVILSALFLSGTLQFLPEEVVPVADAGFGSEPTAFLPDMPGDLPSGRGEEDNTSVSEQEYAISTAADLMQNRAPVAFLLLHRSRLPDGLYLGVRNSRAPPARC